MNILTFSRLFPNREMPRSGIFVAERLRHLLAADSVRATVIAPVPWFPLKSSAFGGYATFARVPAEEAFADIPVFHPRYPSIPKVGMSLAPVLLAAASRRAIRRTIGDLGQFDLIDAHYFYPDGVAAALLGRWFGVPVVITARGTDINLIPEHRIPRRQIKWAMRNAAALVGVSEALAGRLIELGAGPDKVSVLRNGVDLQKFRPLDRESVRSKLGIARTTLLSVGNLVELKGHDIAIEALEAMPDRNLIIVGAGPLRSTLEEQARKAGVADRVRFVGAMDQSELVRYYNAADCLVLCSSREGLANVLVESLACGTPVVATAVGGNPEVIRDPAAGVLMGARTPEALVASLERLFADYPDRETTRTYARRFSWSATTEGQLRLFGEIARGRD